MLWPIGPMSLSFFSFPGIWRCPSVFQSATERCFILAQHYFCDTVHCGNAHEMACFWIQEILYLILDTTWFRYCCCKYRSTVIAVNTKSTVNPFNVCTNFIVTNYPESTGFFISDVTNAATWKTLNDIQKKLLWDLKYQKYKKWRMIIFNVVGNKNNQT